MNLPIPPPTVGPVFRGYARVSTQDQNLDLQIDALKSHGCKKIYLDKMSGAHVTRPGLDKLLMELNPGDTVVIWKLDRLGRSLINLVNLVENFGSRNIHLKVLTGNIDTTTNEGRLIFGIMATLAEYERSLTRERINAGLQAAKRRGKKLGPPVKMTSAKLEAALHMLQGDMMLKDVSRALGVDRVTLWRALKTQDSASSPASS